MADPFSGINLFSGGDAWEKFALISRLARVGSRHFPVDTDSPIGRAKGSVKATF